MWQTISIATLYKTVKFTIASSFFSLPFSYPSKKKGYISWKKSKWGGWRISKADKTFSCLKKHSIFSSRNTRFEDTRDWKTFGSFFKATLRPSLGSVTALRTITRKVGEWQAHKNGCEKYCYLPWCETRRWRFFFRSEGLLMTGFQPEPFDNK